jgi:hypothetical protein
MLADPQTFRDYDPNKKLAELLDGSDNFDEPSLVAPTATNIPPEETHAPAVITEADRLAAEKTEMKNAQDRDGELIEAEKKLTEVNTLPETPEKAKKVEEAKLLVEGKKKAVIEIVEKSKNKVSDTLTVVKEKLKDTEFSIVQSKRKVEEAEKKFNASSQKDKTELTAAQNELNNLEKVQKPGLEKAIKDIQ